jgi:alkylhydroperoxidase/carboxymuconolactone decarboxylase family protein
MTHYSAVFADGALTEREKALIALGVAHAVQCSYYIDAYNQACLEKGSNIEEMTEAVHVACAIRGGATLVHGVQVRNVVQKLGSVRMISRNGKILGPPLAPGWCLP